MDNNEIQGITPLTNNNINSEHINSIEPITTVNTIQNNAQQQSQIPISNINVQEINDEFAHGLPDWDLVPPYTTVRRVNRK